MQLATGEVFSDLTGISMWGRGMQQCSLPFPPNYLNKKKLLIIATSLLIGLPVIVRTVGIEVKETARQVDFLMAAVFGMMIALQI